MLGMVRLEMARLDLSSVIINFLKKNFVVASPNKFWAFVIGPDRNVKFGLAWFVLARFVLVRFISLFEKNSGEKNGGKNSRE